MFKIGQKVVCVDDSKQENICVAIHISYVEKGRIYTVRGFDSIQGILLEEITGGFYFDNSEAGFKESRFIPLKEDRVVDKTLSECLIFLN